MKPSGPAESADPKLASISALASQGHRDSTSPSANVLLVEDDELLQGLMKRYLEEEGYRVLATSEGEKGLVLFRENKFDVVIIDRALGDMQGEDLASELRHDSPGIPLMMTSGLTTKIRQLDWIDSVLSKPFTRQELIDGVGRLLGTTRTPPPPEN
jgi:DNA-binding response OmpR family regulator